MAHLLYNSAYAKFVEQHTMYFLADGDGLQGVILETLHKGINPQIYGVVPTGRRVRYLQRQLTSKYWETTKKPADKLHLSTLEGFIIELYKQIYKDKKRQVISDAYRLALFHEAIENCICRKELIFYSHNGSRISTAIIERLAEVIYGIKKKGITPIYLLDDLKRSVEHQNEDINTNTLQDIVAIYKEYETLLGDTLADKATITYDVATYLSLHTPDVSLFCEDIIICIDGFSEFTIPETAVLSAFASSEVPIVVVVEYSLRNGPLFGNLQEVHERLVSSGFFDTDLDIQNVHDSDEVFKPNTSYIRRWLFNTEKEIRNDNFKNTIRLLECKNRLDEVQSIATYARYLIVKEGIKPAEICIATRQPDTYTQLFREVFSSYDLPVNISDRFPLAKSPVIVALFAVLDVIKFGFRREDVHRALQNPYCFFTTNIGEHINGTNIYNVALRLRIYGGERRKGAKGWIIRLENAIEASKRRLAVVNQDTYAEQIEIDSAQRQLDELIQALSDVQQLQKFLPDKDSMFSVLEFVDEIKESFIKGLKIQETIDVFYKYVTTQSLRNIELIEMLETVEQDSRALGEFISLLDEIAFVYSERFGNRQRSFAEFVDKLEATVRGAKYQIKEKIDYGVTVTSIEQTRGIPYKVMIICGLVDKEFPVAYTPETFLGKELPDSEMRHIKSERMQFYMALANNTKALEEGNSQILLTYPTYSVGDEEFVPSPFIEKLEKITTLKTTRITTQKARKMVRSNSLESTELWCKDWIDSISSNEEALQEYLNHPTTSDLKQYFESQLLLNNIQEILHISSTYYQHKVDEVEISETIENQLKTELLNFKQKPISASDLEEYASCPFRYFSRKFVQLTEDVSDTTTLSPLERGTLLHGIVYRFYQSVATDKVNDGDVEYLQTTSGTHKPILVKLDTNEFNYYYEMLVKIAHEECDRIKYEHPFFELEKESLFGNTMSGSTRKGILETWLRNELDRITFGWDFVPVLFEYGFGMKAKQNSNQHAVKVGDINTRGKIDRVEVKKTTSGDYEFIIADYKTTKPGSSVKEVEAGEKFQIPLYMAAMQKVLESDFGITTEIGGGVYYMFMPKNGKYHQQLLVHEESSVAKVGVSERSRTKIPSKNEVNYTIQHSLDLAKEKVHAIAEGHFSITPLRATTCSYCPFSSICRIKELQLNKQYDIESELTEES